MATVKITIYDTETGGAQMRIEFDPPPTEQAIADKTLTSAQSYGLIAAAAVAALHAEQHGEMPLVRPVKPPN